jgi:Leucine-rich repeat (LRR) protein
LSEKDIQDNYLKTLEHQKIKEKISVEIEAEKELDNLKELVEKGIITKDIAEQIIE